jgi:hypothetical protein
MYEEAKYTLKQAPRIAVPAARTRPEPSQASQNEATRTLGKALSARCLGRRCLSRVHRLCVLPTTPCTWFRTNTACVWSVHSEEGLPCLAITLLPIVSNAS